MMRLWLASFLFFGTSLCAQTVILPGGTVGTPLPSVVFQPSFTTGMVGFTTNQTARLNVLNLSSVPMGFAGLTQPANCTVELQFFDDKGGLVKQTVVPNFVPGTASSLDLPRSSVTSATAARAEIRGVVVINPTTTSAASPVAVGFCSVMTTLEVYDANGSTVSSTSDTRAIGLPNVVAVTDPVTGR